MAWKNYDGGEHNYDGGRFKIRVRANFTTTAIKFKLYCVVNDAFNSSHSAIFSWENPKGKTITKTTSKTWRMKETETYNPFNDTVFSNEDYRITVKCKIGNKTSFVTLTSTLAPPKPSNLTAKYIDNANIKLTIKGSGKPDKPVKALQLYRKTDYQVDNWSAIGDPYYFKTGTTGGNIGSYNVELYDRTVEKGHRYRYAVEALNGENTDVSSGKIIMNLINKEQWVYTQPPDVSEVAHERISDRKNRVSFKRETADVDRRLITQAIIQRSESDGKWTAIATIGVGSAASSEYVTWDDNDCTPNNSYSYRILTKNSQRTAKDPVEIGGTEKTYNTPAGPTSVEAIYNANNSVTLNITNSTRTAMGTVIERTIDDETWEQIEEASSVLTEYTDNAAPTSDNLKYRVKYTRDDLNSGWKISNIPLTLLRPNAPTPVMPVNDTPILLDADTVRLGWIHNATDGTAQTGFNIHYRINGGTMKTIIKQAGTTGADLSYYDFDLTNLSPNDVITWQVATRGALTGQLSPWSEWVSFNVYESPQLTITSPNNGDTVTLPLTIGYSYSDTSGTLDALLLRILEGDEIVYEEELDVSETEFTFSDYLFENNSYYELQLTATSTSGLSTSDNVSIYVNYQSVEFAHPWFVDASVDDNGMVSFNVSEGEENTAGLDVEIESATIYRVVNEKREKVADVQINDQIQDLYAPLNIPFYYEILEKSTTGEIMVITQEMQLESEEWYVYYGPSRDKIARAVWEPNGDVSLTRPERQEIRYSGRIYPVSYDSTAMGESDKFSTIITDREELNHFIEMMRLGGSGIWKSGNGETYNANFEFDYSADYTRTSLMWNCSLEVTRID